MTVRLPKAPAPDRVLYHWSPTTNRDQIRSKGLKKSQPTIQGVDFKPPYICFSEDPQLAWILSGRMFPDIDQWDLWLVHGYQIEHLPWEYIFDTFRDSGRKYIKEIRVYSHIPKSFCHLVGSRTQKEKF